MRKCVRATFLTVRDALRELEQDNTESQATDGTITKAFTVADKTFEPQAFVFRVAVLIETSTASMSQCKKVG